MTNYNYIIITLFPLLYSIFRIKYVLLFLSGYMAFTLGRTSLIIFFLFVSYSIIFGILSTLFQLGIFGLIYAIHKREKWINQAKALIPSPQFMGGFDLNNYVPHTELRMINNQLGAFYRGVMEMPFIEDIVNDIRMSNKLVDREIDQMIALFDQNLVAKRKIT